MESYFDYFMESLDAFETLELISDPRISRRPRIFRKRSDDFAKYDAKDFFIRYRMSKESVLFLLDKIEHLLEYKDNRNKSVSPINQLLCALRYFATGNVLQAVGDLNGVSVATCSRIIKRVSEAIVTLRNEFIRFPETEEEQSVVKGEFYRIARFPNVLGCIDCTHIKIQSPGGDDAELFRNRKSYMSVNVQTVSSAKLLITDIVARWPGSTHDSTIYQNSRRYSKFQRGDYGGAFLLGDSGYPLKSHLLTPYLNPTTFGQHKYNEAHIKTRNVVERQYGVLKRRFPVLAVGIRLKLKTTVSVIVACAILHNICMLRKAQNPTTDSSIPDLEELITAGQIPRIQIVANDPTYEFLYFQSHLLTPYLNPTTFGQHKYNEAHIKTRNVVERQYGVLKRRFPVLAVGIRLKLKTTVSVIVACAILHNICMLRKEQNPTTDSSIPDLEELITAGQIPRIQIVANDPTYGFQRNQITQYFADLEY